MSIDAKGLLSSIYGIKFVFGLHVLKTVFFPNTMDTLWVFLQSQKMDVITANKTVGPIMVRNQTSSIIKETSCRK